MYVRVLYQIQHVYIMLYIYTVNVPLSCVWYLKVGKKSFEEDLKWCAQCTLGIGGLRV